MDIKVTMTKAVEGSDIFLEDGVPLSIQSWHAYALEYDDGLLVFVPGVGLGGEFERLFRRR